MRQLLTHRYTPLGLALLGMLLASPALFTGWIVDDYFHHAVFAGSEVFGDFVSSPLDQFRFFDGDIARTKRMIDIGFLPWFTYPGLKGAFWRPLTTLTHWLDYQLWPTSPLLMHAQSLVWYGVLIVAVTALYRRFLPGFAAGLAALLYAIDDAHAVPLGFLANRNAIIATVFGVLAIVAHDRWRRDGWQPGAICGPLALAASLLAKEAGLATVAYLFAHAVILDRGRWPARLAVLSPYVFVVIVWRMVWSHVGQAGFANVGFYVDPLHEPGAFALALVERAPLLLLGQWALPPAETPLLLSTAAQWWLWAVAVVVLAALGLLVARLLRDDRVARFWIVGMLLATVPICTTFPADRLLMFVGLGAMGLLAQLLVRASPRNQQADVTARGVRIAVGALVVIHFVLAPVALPIRAALPAGPPSIQAFVMRPQLDESVREQDLVVVNPPSFLHAAYFLVEQELRGEPLPRRVRLLAPGLQAATVTRADERTLHIRLKKGYIAWRFERLLREADRPFGVGDVVDLTGMSAKVLAVTDDGRPLDVAFRFRVPLEDPSLRWICFRDGKWVTFDLPAVGQSVTLSAPELW